MAERTDAAELVVIRLHYGDPGPLGDQNVVPDSDRSASFMFDLPWDGRIVFDDEPIWKKIDVPAGQLYKPILTMTRAGVVMPFSLHCSRFARDDTITLDKVVTLSVTGLPT